MRTLVGWVAAAAFGAVALAVTAPHEARGQAAQAQDPNVQEALRSIYGLGGDARPAAPQVSEEAAATAPVDPVTGRAVIDVNQPPLSALLNADMGSMIARARQDTGGLAAAALLVVVDDVAAGRPDAAQAALDAMPAEASPYVKTLAAWTPALLGDDQRALWTLEDNPIGPGGTDIDSLMLAFLLDGMGDVENATVAYDRGLAGVTPDFDPQRGPMGLISPMVRAQAMLFAASAHARAGSRMDAARYVERAAFIAPDDLYVRQAARAFRADAVVAPAPTDAEALARAMWMITEIASASRTFIAVMNGERELGLDAESAMMRQAALVIDPDLWPARQSAFGDLTSVGAFTGAARLAERGVAVAAAPWERAEWSTYAGVARTNAQDDARALAHVQVAAQAPGVVAETLADAAAVASYLARADLAQTWIAQARTNAVDEEAVAYVADAEAEIARQAGDFDAAIAAMRRSVEASPKPRARLTLGALLVRDDATREEGVAILRDLVQEDGEDPGRLNQLGFVLIKEPETLTEGFRLLARAYALAPEDYAILDSFGWAHYLHGDFDTARRLIAQAARLMEPFPSPQVLMNLGDVYWRLERPKLARDAWARALAEGRPAEDMRAALERRIAQGLEGAGPDVRPLPSISLDREQQI